MLSSSVPCSKKALQNEVEPVVALGGLPHEEDFELVGAMSDASKRLPDHQYPVSSKANLPLLRSMQ